MGTVCTHHCRSRGRVNVSVALLSFNMTALHLCLYTWNKKTHHTKSAINLLYIICIHILYLDEFGCELIIIFSRVRIQVVAWKEKSNRCTGKLPLSTPKMVKKYINTHFFLFNSISTIWMIYETKCKIRLKYVCESSTSLDDSVGMHFALITCLMNHLWYINSLFTCR